MISVVVCNYNYGKYLEECIESLLKQTFDLPYEIIIVDDGSTDNSREIIEKFTSKKIRAIYQENSGQFAALSRGVKEANYDIICFCDSDDLFNQDKLEIIHRYFQYYPEVVMIQHVARVFGNNDSNCSFRPTMNILHKPLFYPKMRSIQDDTAIVAMTSCLNFRKKSIEKLAGFQSLLWNHKHYGDILFRSIGLITGPSMFIKEILVSYRDHEKSISNLDGSITIMNRKSVEDKTAARLMIEYLYIFINEFLSSIDEEQISILNNPKWRRLAIKTNVSHSLFWKVVSLIPDNLFIQLLRFIKYPFIKKMKIILNVLKNFFFKKYFSKSPSFNISYDQIRIKEYKDKYRDKRCFIIGNGPSLNNIDLNLLKNEYTFGVNCIFYKFDEIGFKPTFYMVEDSHVITDNRDRINEIDYSIKFFPYVYQGDIIKDKNTIFFHADLDFYNPFHPFYEKPRFSFDCAELIYAGQTVTYMNLQLAFFMGFREIYLVGMDFSYKVPPRNEIISGTITSKEDDPNHFHPDYFGKGKKWHDPKLENCILSYAYAKKIYNLNGRKIYNATIGGNLEVFERISFNSLFD